MGSGKPRVKLPVLSEWQKRAIPALEESIAHWDRMASGQRREGEGMYDDDCACCGEFDQAGLGSCDGCPVATRTGESSCVGTPWHEAHEAWFDHEYDSGQFRAAAAVERDWLKETLEMVKRGAVKP